MVLMATTAKSEVMYLNPFEPTAGKKYPKNTPAETDGKNILPHPAEKEMPKGIISPFTDAFVDAKPIIKKTICLITAIVISDFVKSAFVFILSFIFITRYYKLLMRFELLYILRLVTICQKPTEIKVHYRRKKKKAVYIVKMK